MLGVVVLFIVVLVVFVAINISPTGDALTEIVIYTAEMLNMPPEATASMTDYLDVFFNWLRNMVGLIFSLAPSGLFFMIVVAYAVGIADIGVFGAFVRRAQTVESLSQVTTLCLSKGAAMSGAEVQLDMIPLSDGRQAMQASHVTQILGSFARSQQNSDFIIRAIIDNFDGEAHLPKQDFYYLNAFGWGAIVFDDIDLRGTLCYSAYHKS